MAFVAVALFSANALAQQPSLDGKSFQGTMKDDKGKAFADTFEFANGQFHSSACDKYGFGRASYTLQPDGRFEATTVSAKEGTMQWRGQVQGSNLQGEAIWLKPGKAPVRYQVQGTLK
jgi:hypothetical protein